MSKSVLIVDDQPQITAALMMRLQAAGYTVYHAINGLAGVEAAALHHPDIVILDIRMPDIDGFDACIRIKRLPGLDHTRIIFLSANSQEANRLRAQEVGASEFMSKPFKAADILKVIERVLMVSASEIGA
ncbi:MAG TPA: response regulator [Phycisphaerales bacterium]|nr:response regulator [Phycisphaerales bacterium]